MAMPETSAAQEIAALRAELVATRAQVQEFAYSVSHDLRAQLRHITAFAQILQEDAGPQLDAQAQSHLTTISTAARTMASLMDGLMEFARVGMAPVQPEAVPLQTLVQEVCHSLQTQHPARVVDWRVAPDLPAVQADAALLRQIFTHVLGNAWKFTAPRSTAVVEVGWLAQEGGHALVWVRDNGVGFNPAQQAKLFQVFQRLHSVRDFPGLGMGLALTRKILERHGSSVTAQGDVDAGCCIQFSLPLG